MTRFLFVEAIDLNTNLKFIVN